jgi:hypothetical protein
VRAKSAGGIRVPQYLMQYPMMTPPYLATIAVVRWLGADETAALGQPRGCEERS